MPQSNKPSLFTFGNTISPQNARKNKSKNKTKKIEKGQKEVVMYRNSSNLRPGEKFFRYLVKAKFA